MFFLITSEMLRLNHAGFIFPTWLIRLIRPLDCVYFPHFLAVLGWRRVQSTWFTSSILRSSPHQGLSDALIGLQWKHLSWCATQTCHCQCFLKDVLDVRSFIKNRRYGAAWADVHESKWNIHSPICFAEKHTKVFHTFERANLFGVAKTACSGCLRAF